MKQALGTLAMVLLLSGCGNGDWNGMPTDGSIREAACANLSYDPISIYIVQSSGIVKIYSDSSKGPGSEIKIVQSSAIVKIGVNPHQPVRLKIVQSSAIVKTEGVCVVL